MVREARASSLVTVLLVVAALIGVLMVAGCGGETTTTEATATTSAPETTVASTTATTAGTVYQIGLTQIVSHPTLDVAREAIIEGLKMEGFEDGKNIEIDFQNAGGDMAVGTSIGQKFANDNKDLVISITTPMTQAMAKANPDRPIVFCLVTDPVGAGLLKDLKAPEGNITGVHDFYDISFHLDLIKELLPEAKTIGLLYNAGEANSIALVVNSEKPKALEMGFEVVEATAASSAEVQAAAQSLVGRVDVISITTDNTIVSGLEAVLKVGADNDIPVVMCDVDSVERGAVAAYGMNNVSMGNKAGIMAGKILKGTPIKDIPVDTATDYELMINLKAAADMGVTVPQALLDKAVKVFE
ncbi:MAG: ABC transporter substrate-binding protein [Gaiellales bacterium]|nr:ABC transporter substrate-binding protein [Gaiellales bacterium]